MKRFIKYLAISAFFGVQIHYAKAQSENPEYTISQGLPDWVEELKLDYSQPLPDKKVTDGIYYKLVDTQISVRETSVAYYFRAVWQVVNQNGIENSGQMSINFDPSYERLILHKVDLIRGGQTTNQINREYTSLLQRETEIQNQIYNGTKTFNLLLNDVRVGDIIEYSYTIKGYNPALSNTFFGGFSTQWSSHIAKVHCRLLWPEDRKLHIKYHGPEIEPRITQKGGFSEYLWTWEDADRIVAEETLPLWFQPYGWIQLSESRNWKDVCQLALQHYQKYMASTPSIKDTIESISKNKTSPKDIVTHVLRFLQDEVRYTGIEIGARAYVPTIPSKVLERRFGDCKDKSLLMVAMLRGMGISATPALVSTEYRLKLKDLLPSFTVFNHVFVRVVIDDQIYWLDPTLSYQRGSLDDLYQPDYGLALVLDENTTDLIKIARENNDKPTKLVNEIYDLRSGTDQPVIYTVTTVYRSFEADFVRKQLATVGHAEMQENYLNYFSRIWPSVQIKNDIKVLNRENQNEVEITEVYEIPDFWKEGKSARFRLVEFYPFDISEYFSKPSKTKRKMPLSISHPVHRGLAKINFTFFRFLGFLFSV